MSTKKPTPKPIHHVEIGGRQRPVRFGMNALRTYNDVTGTTLAGLQATFTPPPEVAAEFAAAEAEGRAPTVSWMPSLTAGQLIGLVFSGLQDGARKEHAPADFDQLDVGDWLDEAGDDVLAEVFAAFAGGQGDQKSADNGAAETEGKGEKKPAAKK